MNDIYRCEVYRIFQKIFQINYVEESTLDHIYYFLNGYIDMLENLIVK